MRTIQTRFNAVFPTRVIQNQKGFTLVELFIVLILMAGILSLAMGPSAQLWRWIKESENKRNLDSLQKGLEQLYKLHAWEIDGSDTNTFVFSLSGTNYTLSNGLGTANANRLALQAISTMAQLSRNDIDKDASHNALNIFVSNRLTDSVSGARYHTIAIVSAGWDAVLQSTFDQATGVANLLGDDVGIIVNGLLIELDIMEDSRKKLANARDAYQNYFTARYLADPTKNVYVTRFARESAACAANAWWDAGVAVRNSACVTEATMSGTGLRDALGMSTQSVTSLYGREIIVDNNSAATRNPGTTGVAIPYTARLAVELPWGSTLDATVSGLY